MSSFRRGTGLERGRPEFLHLPDGSLHVIYLVCLRRKFEISFIALMKLSRGKDCTCAKHFSSPKFAAAQN
jgi:hypothetical protein